MKARAQSVRFSRSSGKFTLGLLCLVTAGCLFFGSHRSGRVFHLTYRMTDFVVPAGEKWRLSWSSPYEPGDISPGYDVRVLSGSVCLGERGEIQTMAFDPLPGKESPIDLAATRGQAIVWLESGTEFCVANEFLRIEVRTYESTDRDPASYTRL